MKSNHKLGELIQNVDAKNEDLHCDNLKGFSITKEFRTSTSNIDDVFKEVLEQAENFKKYAS